MDLQLIPLTDRIFKLVGRENGRFPHAHSFLVRDDVIALIDTGCGLDVLTDLKRRWNVDMVINSHGHPDHGAGNWLFPGVPLYAPIQGAESHGRLLALSHRFFGRTALAGRWRSWIRESMGFQDHVPTDFFDDGREFHFGRTKLHAVFAPGHTCDHYCLFEPESGLLLSFDIDLTPFGPWYGHQESSISDFRASLERLILLRPRTIASTHWEVVTEDADAALKQYGAILDRRNEAILGLVNDGAGREQIMATAPFYGRYPYAVELLKAFEGRMVDLHLEELLREGLIHRDGEIYHRC